MTLIGSRVVLILLLVYGFWLALMDSIPVTGGEYIAPYRIQLRTASAVELELLPGIGPVTAQRIMQYRLDHVVIEPEDLLGVYGIGQKTIDQLRRLVTTETVK